ncbi:MAG: hypothetical protein ACE147_11275 [Candidatus Methylomirabilales bacterium]
MSAACAPRSVLVLLLAGSLLLPACARLRGGRPAEPVAPAPAAPVPAPAPPAPPRTGRLASEETLRQLIPGQTTRAEVRERFGTPREVIVSPGVETFVYFRDRTSGWISRSTERVEMLIIRLDTKGILKDFEYRYSGE